MIEYEAAFNPERSDLELKIAIAQSGLKSVTSRLKNAPLNGQQMAKLHQIYRSYSEAIDVDAALIGAMDLVEITSWANEVLGGHTEKDPLSYFDDIGLPKKRPKSSIASIWVFLKYITS